MVSLRGDAINIIEIISDEEQFVDGIRCLEIKQTVRLSRPKI